MKNVIIVVAIAALTTVCSCKKEIIQKVEPSIIYTDSPPDKLFSKDQTYATTYQVWLDQSAIDEAKDQGSKCSQYYDSGTGTYTFSDCGHWYMVPAKKYWGIIGSVQYVSKSQDWYAVSPNVYLNTLDAIKRKQTAIGSICQACPNPLGAMILIAGIQ